MVDPFAAATTPLQGKALSYNNVLDASAADWLGDRRVKVFGVDTPSPDNPIDRTYPVYLFCREHGVTHYENLANLGEV